MVFRFLHMSERPQKSIQLQSFHFKASSSFKDTPMGRVKSRTYNLYRPNKLFDYIDKKNIDTELEKMTVRVDLWESHTIFSYSSGFRS